MPALSYATKPVPLPASRGSLPFSSSPTLLFADFCLGAWVLNDTLIMRQC